MELLHVTLAQVLSHHAAHWGGDTAYIFEDTVYTWGQIDAVTDRMAIAMVRDGVGKGAHVGIWGVNSVPLICTIFAAMKLGAVPVVFNYSYKELELRTLISYADVSALYYGSSTGSLDYPKILAQIQKKRPALALCRDLNGLFQACLDHPGLPQGDRQALEAAKSAVRSEDTACMLFTSGTTQRPKGVLLSYFNILNDARQIDALMGWTQDDRLLAAMPIFHCSGLTCCVMLGVMLGMPLVVMPTFKPEPAMALIERWRCTAFNVVPSMLMQIVQHPAFGQYDLSSWRSGTSSGSGMTPDRYEQLTKQVNVPFLQVGYGQTETSPLITFSRYEDDPHTKAHTIGVPIPHMEVRIWDLHHDEPAPIGTPGEIQARGFCVMQGYYKLEEENRRKFTADGWLRTGDIGYQDERGYFHFSTRMSEVIIRGGENISPSEIECVIEHFSPDIEEVKVVGMEVDTALQEEIVAFLRMKPGTHVDGGAVSAYVKSCLASFKAPKYVWELERFPMTGSGKVDQKALKALAPQMAAQERS